MRTHRQTARQAQFSQVAPAVRRIALQIINEDGIRGKGPKGELSASTVRSWFDNYDGKKLVNDYFSVGGIASEKRWNKGGFLRR